MAEILICARDLRSHADPIKDRAGSYKRGMPVVVMPDGHQWGRLETLPDFAVVRIPNVAVSAVEKYIRSWDSAVNPGQVVQRRRWKLRIPDMPAALQNRIQNAGFLVVAPAGFVGQSDAPWSTFRGFLRNEETGLDEIVDL